MARRVDDLLEGGKMREARWRPTLRVGLWVCVLAPIAAPVQAQFADFGPATSGYVAVAAERPAFSGGATGAFVAHAAFVTPVRPRITFAGGLSIVHARERDRPTSTVLSNAFLEFHFGGERGFGTLTITLPTSGRLINTEAYAADLGLAADLERPERFTRGTSGFSFRLNRRYQLGRNSVVGARAGAAMVAPSGFSREFYGRYGAFTESLFGSVRVGAEVTGAAFFNPDPIGRDRSIGEVTVHHVALFAGIPTAGLSPHIFARFRSKPIPAGYCEPCSACASAR